MDEGNKKKSRSGRADEGKNEAFVTAMEFFIHHSQSGSENSLTAEVRSDSLSSESTLSLEQQSDLSTPPRRPGRGSKAIARVTGAMKRSTGSLFSPPSIHGENPSRMGSQNSESRSTGDEEAHVTAMEFLAELSRGNSEGSLTAEGRSGGLSRESSPALGQQLDPSLPPQRARRDSKAVARVTGAMKRSTGSLFSPSGVHTEDPSHEGSQNSESRSTEDEKAHVTAMAFLAEMSQSSSEGSLTAEGRSGGLSRESSPALGQSDLFLPPRRARRGSKAVARVAGAMKRSTDSLLLNLPRGRSEQTPKEDGEARESYLDVSPGVVLRQMGVISLHQEQDYEADDSQILAILKGTAAELTGELEIITSQLAQKSGEKKELKREKKSKKRHLAWNQAKITELTCKETETRALAHMADATDYYERMNRTVLGKGLRPVILRLGANQNELLTLSSLLVGAKHMLNTDAAQGTADGEERTLALRNAQSGIESIFGEHFHFDHWISGNNNCLAVVIHEKTQKKFTVKRVPVPLDSAWERLSCQHAFFRIQKDSTAAALTPDIYAFLHIEDPEDDPRGGIANCLEISEYFSNGSLLEKFRSLHCEIASENAEEVSGETDNEEIYEKIIILALTWFTKISASQAAQQITHGVYSPDIKPDNFVLNEKGEPKFPDRKEQRCAPLEDKHGDDAAQPKRCPFLKRPSEMGVTGQYFDDRVLARKETDSDGNTAKKWVDVEKLMFQSDLISFCQCLTNNVPNSADKLKYPDLTHPIFKTKLAKTLSLAKQIRGCDELLTELEQEALEVNYLNHIHTCFNDMLQRVPPDLATKYQTEGGARDGTQQAIDHHPSVGDSISVVHGGGGSMFGAVLPSNFPTGTDDASTDTDESGKFYMH